MKCFLHIGTEKTGTTLLQDWLYANQGVLSDRGIFLSKVIGHTNNRKLCAFVQDSLDDFFSDRKISNRAQRDAFFEGFLDELFREISEAKKTHDSIIITSEHFSSRLINVEEIALLKEALLKFSNEFKVIAYFREQSELRKSLYSTHLRVGGWASLEDFVPAISTSDHYFNYDVMLTKWSNIFGKGSIEPVIYDRSSFVDGDIRKDFIVRVDKDIDLQKFDYSLESANESMSYMQAILLRAINLQMGGRYHKDGTLNIRRLELVERILREQKLKRGRLVCKRHLEIYEQFNEANIAFFSKFFGKKKNLFSPPENNGQEESVYGFEPALVDSMGFLIECFAGEGGVERLSLKEDVVNVLRDVALKYDTQKAITKDEALKLMGYAHRGRPKGLTINAFLNKHKDQGKG